ncbi:MAG: methyltransferase domain-containing protein [bacterium]
MRYRAKKQHTPDCGMPVVAAEGQRLVFERRPTEYRGWIWCRSESGGAGWIPEAWVRIEGEQCTLLRDYNAAELPLAVGEEVTGALRESGWAWVRNARGDCGWVPDDCLEPGEHRDRRYYGWCYHVCFDRALDVGRDAVVDLVPEGSSVIDIGCGTGDLCFALRREKGCRVVGVDMSRRMLDFATRRNPCDEVRFLRQDATNLEDFAAQSFDCATVSLLLHELGRQARAQVLGEALRVAPRVIVADWMSPLPRGLNSISVRFIEWAGRHHFQHFKDYLAGGGIDGVLVDLGAPECLGRPASVVHRATLRRACRHIVVIEAS